MPKLTTAISGASNTQKMIMLALAEGWTLNFVDNHGWCLFQKGRYRPFSQIKTTTVDHMTAKGWLTAGIATKEQNYRPAKFLSPIGLRYAEKLIKLGWAEQTDWDPYQYHVTGPVDGVNLNNETSFGLKAA
ncbi:MAG TPA: hypothetical protein VG711_01225 [Phycisphaerales bacterium]|nr:hypothetical protein [Phycisphaerales bacterium]